MSEQDLNAQNIENEESVEQVEAEEVEAEEVEAAEGTVETGEDRIAELEKELKATKELVASQQDSVLRGKAEVENMRRRVSQDVEKAHKFALNKFANELLPVVDNLERALAAADKESEHTKAMVEGVEMTLNSMLSALEKSGVTPINPKGETFNPELHQAMTMIEVPGAEPNSVIDVMQKGFELNGRLLRPAMVVVAKGNGVDTNA
ncbi:nucleotide exchange factor GrpE [Psychrobium sp. MM17-31]|uniref:nucleotide exchange factor GrpE n=1 Tax=Psychrobium sp. MM17-31 TaxID=2917758 RepID=UPI001EF40176|nr:nucleotide exchange factor GrpE [Psychrobium sp. MM17-31]MCG7532002.1 nucleotide exchange factor GrpE [Psychrobium sp. MM17-31]